MVRKVGGTYQLWAEGDALTSSDPAHHAAVSARLPAGEGTRLRPCGRTDGLLRSTILLTLATGILNGASWLYHVFMSRALGPADYGGLSALIGLLVILSVPINTMQMGLSAFVARVGANQNQEDAVLRVIVARSTKWSLAFGLLGFAILAAVSGWIARLMKLDSSTPVLIMSTVLISSTVLPVLRGALQGTGQFTALGISIAAEGILKVAGGVVLVTLGFGLNGAVAGLSLAILGALVLALLPLRDWVIWRRDNGSLDLRGLLRSLVPYAAMIGCFTILTQADVVLVKVLFPAREAGIYAAASTGGKVILYATMALPMVIVPEMARRKNTSGRSLKVLTRGLFYGAVGGGALVVAYFLAPAAAIRFLFGEVYQEAAPLLGPLGAAMLAYELALMCAYYLVEASHHELLWGLALIAAAFPFAVWLLRDDIRRVAEVMWALGLLSLALSGLGVRRIERAAQQSGARGA